MANAAGINVATYRDRKNAGLISATKAGNAYVLTTRRFDPETGEEVNPQPTVVTIDALNEAKTALQLQITGIDALIADLEGLE